jgi:hypothetical protein
VGIDAGDADRKPLTKEIVEAPDVVTTAEATS